MLCAAILALFLGIFLTVEMVGIPLLQNPLPSLRGHPVAAAAIGFSLLVADAVIPIPASLVMIAHGAIFGLVGGALLSLVGSVCSAVVGFGIGRAGEKYYARIVRAEEREGADRLLERWGTLAVVVTRPIPLLAETVAVMAGVSGVRWKTLVMSAAIGGLPSALLYAWAGTAGRVDMGVWPFAAAILVAGVLFVAGRLFAILMQPQCGPDSPAVGDEAATSSPPPVRPICE